MNCFQVVVIVILLLILVRCYSCKIMWFYDPNCGHCQQMKSEWKRFEFMSVFTIIPPIKTKKIDITKECNINLVKNFGVSAVPHIVKVRRDGTREIYNGPRRAIDIWYWATS